LKPERWGSLLVQGKYREEMPVTETTISYNNNIEDKDWRRGLAAKLSELSELLV